jgi:uncharacterized protein (TIGR00159 family)
MSQSLVAALSILRWQSIVDFVFLASAIYLLLRWGREARTLRIILGILILGVGSLLARQLGLLITSWVLTAANVVAVAAFLVVFQSEFRRAVRRLDILIPGWSRRVGGAASELRAISDAAFSLAGARRGALIVLARRDPLTGLISGGVPLGGEISTEILEAIFRKVSPVHDGAAIVEDTRIARVGAVLPLTERDDLPSGYGTRHRAAIGLSERCDAIVIVVSEERGEVTLIHEGHTVRPPKANDLFVKLQDLESPSPPWDSTQRRPAILTSGLGFAAAAVGLAALVWLVPLLAGESSVRTVTVPIEYRNVPDDLEISGASATTIQAQLRAGAWAFDTISFATLVARFDLGGAREGVRRIVVDPRALNLPPGISVERMSPQELTVNLLRRSDPRMSPPTAPK